MKTRHITLQTPLTEDDLVLKGFVQTQCIWRASKRLSDSDFEARLTISTANLLKSQETLVLSVESDIMDSVMNEPFLPYSQVESQGGFVTGLVHEVECWINDVFHSAQLPQDFYLHEIQRYIALHYSVLGRNPFTRVEQAIGFYTPIQQKWFALMMPIDATKLSATLTGTVWIINLKLNDEKDDIIDFKQVFPAYHMNKKYWVSYVLNNQCDMDLVKRLINTSFNNVEKSRSIS